MDHFGYSVCRETINNVLVENGLKTYKAPQKPIIAEISQEKRAQFAIKHRKLKVQDRIKIIFSDESPFPLNTSSVQVFVRREKDETYLPETIQPASRYSKHILVWGSVSYNGVRPLVRIEGDVNGAAFLNIFRFRLKKYYPDLYTGNWQENNAPAHKSKVVTKWFEKCNTKVKKWPTQSPDLISIDCL